MITIKFDELLLRLAAKLMQLLGNLIFTLRARSARV